MIDDASAVVVNEELDSKDKNDEYRTDYVNNFLPDLYNILIECDGGPDHNLTIVSNQVSIFGLFLVGNMDKIISICGFPALSYLNTVEK